MLFRQVLLMILMGCTLLSHAAAIRDLKDPAYFHEQAVVYGGQTVYGSSDSSPETIDLFGDTPCCILGNSSAYVSTTGNSIPTITTTTRAVGDLASASAHGRIEYQVQIVPLYESFNIAQINIQASGSVRIDVNGVVGKASSSAIFNIGPHGQLASMRANTCIEINPQLYFDCAGNGSSAGFTFDDTYVVRAFTPIPIQLSVTSSVTGRGDANVYAEAFVDPIITILPEYAPYFRLEYSPGLLVNSAETPEPKTVVAGLPVIASLLIASKRRRKRQ